MHRLSFALITALQRLIFLLLQAFMLGYADNTHLKGFQGKDVVQLGDYYAFADFGAITDCNSPDFNDVDGIVGFYNSHGHRTVM